MYVDNITFYYGQERVMNPVYGNILRSQLPGNFIVNDFHSEIYVLPNEPHAILALYPPNLCIPDVEEKRYFNLTNSSTPLKENPKQSTNFIAIRLELDIYRKASVNLQNIDSSNYTGGLYPNYIFIGSYLTEMTIRELHVSHSKSYYAIHSHQFFDKVEIYDVYIEHTDALEIFIFEISFINTLIMNNITINNNDISSNDPTGIFYLNTFKDGSIKLSNITITNSDIGAKHAFEYRIAQTGSMTIEDVSASNVTLGTDTKLFKTQQLINLTMTNSMFSQIHPKDQGDSSTKIIDLSAIHLTDQMNYMISDTMIEQSTVGFLTLSGIDSQESLSTDFAVSNFTYIDSYLEFPIELISYTSIETENGFKISMNDINIENITFVRTGSLFMLGHQTSTTLTITNAYFSNLVGAQIAIMSSNLQNTELMSKVRMSNITATQLRGSSNSFISIYEGGELHIEDSSFTKIENTERGAVLNAGYKNSITEVCNSTFKNNISVYGGVANVQDGSVIRFYD